MHDKHLQLLKQNAIKVTPQRLTIISLLHENGHLSIKEIFSKIKATFPSISLATIYKNINFLQQKDVLKEVKLTDFDSKYEITKEPHAHLVCSKCGNIEDASIDMSKIIQEFESQHSFKVSINSLEVTGVCENCR